MFVIGCSANTSKDVENEENRTIRLNVIESSDERIIATEDSTDIRYQISNSNIKITDNNDNLLSWDELKNAKIIEVYYSGRIKEVSPAIFEKIVKAIVIS
jgi:acetylglutamate kinase